MPQRYYAVTPAVQGCNFYQTYSPPATTVGSVPPGGPSQSTELGTPLGTTVNGNLNTRWVFCQTGNNLAINPGTGFSVDGTFTVGGVVAPVLNCSALVSSPANTNNVRLWGEFSGATLNLTPAIAAQQQHAEDWVQTRAEGAAQSEVDWMPGRPMGEGE